jgi:hypothetical protein
MALPRCLQCLAPHSYIPLGWCTLYRGQPTSWYQHVPGASPAANVKKFLWAIYIPVSMELYLLLVILATHQVKRYYIAALLIYLHKPGLTIFFCNRSFHRERFLLIIFAWTIGDHFQLSC